MTAVVAIALGLLPVALLLLRVALVIAVATNRVVGWLLEEPEGAKGFLARVVVVVALLHGVGVF